MILYGFQCGTSNFNGTEYPAPYYLIKHENGYVLFDSGHNLKTITNPKDSLSDITLSMFKPSVTESDYIINSLEIAGVKPADIMYHICSHLHYDHAGGIGLFPNATYIVQRQELHYAYTPDPFMKHVYLRADFDKDVNWLLLDGWQDNKYDLFGDGKIIIYFTPGHTPGHQSLLVNLDESGPFFLTADACYILASLDSPEPSILASDNSAYFKSLSLIKDFRKRGTTIIAGHDPDIWSLIKKFPDCNK